VRTWLLLAGTWLLLAGAVLCEVSGSLSLKLALDHRWLYSVVVVGYTSSFALLAMVLRRGMPLGVAYGIWGASGVALTAVLSALVLGEPFTALVVLGLVLIVGGVLTVELGSERAQSAREAD